MKTSRILALAVLSTLAALSHADVSLPKISEKTFTITDHGAVADGKTLANDAIKKTIDAASASGGGIVRIPSGEFLTGPFELASNINLHLDEGAKLTLINDIETYPKNEKTYLDWITAKNCHDIAITGKGTIDGQGQPWWDKYRKVNGVAPKLLHRPMMIRLGNCTRVLVQDVTLTNSPMFHLIPEDSQDVTIDHITIKSPASAPNTDGIDPSGLNFHITNCTIDTGDDNIALKPARPKDGHPACENFLIENCTFLHGHGMSIGGQTPGGLKHLLVRNCSFDSTEAGIRMKAPRGNGGLVEDCTYENLTMDHVKVPIYITSYYPSIPSNVEHDAKQEVTSTTPIWRNIHITNLKSTNSPEAGRILGLPEMHVSNVVLENVHISAEKGMRIVHADEVRFINSSIEVKKGKPLIEFDAQVSGLGEGK